VIVSLRRLGRRLAGERGYSLIEMLTVLSILGVVMSGLTTLFVQGSNAEVDMNNRFQAQGGSRLALDKLRREVHCASSAATSGTAVGSLYPTVALTLPSGCPTGSGTITWCTSQVGTGTRYALYRYTTGSTCTAGVKWADYLTSGAVFAYTAASTSSLASLHIDLPVNPRPAKSFETYRLCDDIYFRNSTRTGTPGASPPTC
jgi:prepilin-type N-terminal cleavage/methylation domain-containing protein